MVVFCSVVLTDEVPGKEFSGSTVSAHASPEPDDFSTEMSWGWQWRGAAAIGSSSYGSTNDLPFWLHSNRSGELDRYSANTTLNLFGTWRHTFDSGISLEASGVVGNNQIR